MPSPFPGMDPFLELYTWGDFHFSLIYQMKRQLIPQLGPQYTLLVEERAYLEHTDKDQNEHVADILIEETPPQPTSPVTSNLVATLEPETHIVPMPSEMHEHFLVIYEGGGNDVVTVIELLSPTNKRRGSDGCKEYQLKREGLRRSYVNLVEIDLLRGGERPPLNPPLRTSSDYAVSVHRQRKRPAADVYQWSMRRALPIIPVPLVSGDPDIKLDLQQAFVDVWNESNYSKRVQNDQKLKPSTRREDEAWLSEIISKANQQR